MEYISKDYNSNILSAQKDRISKHPPHLELDQLATLDSMLLVRRFTRFNPSIKHGLQKNSTLILLMAKLLAGCTFFLT